MDLAQPWHSPRAGPAASRFPRSLWEALRALFLGVAIGLTLALFLAPDMASLIVWGLVVPLLPVLFLVAPGFWRNVCPLATVNQLPRNGRFSWNGAAPRWLREQCVVVSIGLLTLGIVGRRIFFEDSALALAALLIGVFVAAFLGGVLLRGKSGWCGTLCPLAPLERFYGQTPLHVVRDSHCAPCTACMKNCYDLIPTTAHLADLQDTTRRHGLYRQYFASAFPGLIVAFYISPDGSGALDTLLLFVFCVAASVGVFSLLSVFLHVAPSKIAAVSAALSLSLYYWFTLPTVTGTVAELLQKPVPETLIPITVVPIFACAVWWLGRAFAHDSAFVAKRASPMGAQPLAAPRTIAHPDQVARRLSA